MTGYINRLASRHPRAYHGWMNLNATRIFVFVGLCAATLALMSCDARSPSPYSGALYFGNGAYLMRLGLQNGDLSVAGHLGDTVIRDVSPYSGDYLLIAETASLNRQRVPRIAWFNRRTGEKGDFYGGVRARLLASASVLVYDDGSKLFAVPQADRSDNRLIHSHSGSAITAMLEGSPGVLLMEFVEDGAYSILAWDAASGDMRRLDELAVTCRLEGAVWIDALERLACQQRGGGAGSTAFILSDLQGRPDGELELPADRQFTPLAYIDSQRVLVLQEARKSWVGQGQKYGVWLYPVDGGELVHLADDIRLGQAVTFAEH